MKKEEKSLFIKLGSGQRYEFPYYKSCEIIPVIVDVTIGGDSFYESSLLKVTDKDGYIIYFNYTYVEYFGEM